LSAQITVSHPGFSNSRVLIIVLIKEPQAWIKYWVLTDVLALGKLKLSYILRVAYSLGFSFFVFGIVGD
jgi:hypothetical protein